METRGSYRSRPHCELPFVPARPSPSLGPSAPEPHPLNAHAAPSARVTRPRGCPASQAVDPSGSPPPAVRPSFHPFDSGISACHDSRPSVPPASTKACRSCHDARSSLEWTHRSSERPPAAKHAVAWRTARFLARPARHLRPRFDVLCFDHSRSRVCTSAHVALRHPWSGRSLMRRSSRAAFDVTSSSMRDGAVTARKIVLKWHGQSRHGIVHTHPMHSRLNPPRPSLLLRRPSTITYPRSFNAWHSANVILQALLTNSP